MAHSKIGALAFLACGCLAGCCGGARCRPCPSPDATVVMRSGNVEILLAPSGDATPPDLPPPGTPPPSPAAKAPPPPGFAEALAAIRAEKDPGAQRKAVAALHARARDAFLALDPGVLAALAPDVLRVYDLSPALAEGGDSPEPVPSFDLTQPAPAESADLTPTTRRAERIARSVRDGLASDSGDSFVDVRAAAQASFDQGGVGTCLVVLADSDRFQAVTSRLDATTGGAVVRATVDFLKDAAALAMRLGADPASKQAHPIDGAVPSEETLAPLRVERFVLDVSFGRTVGARRSTASAYVQDFDVETSMGGPMVSDPIVGTLREGLAAGAYLVPGHKQALFLHLTLSRAEVIRPIPTFETMVAEGQGGRQVRIELPELRIRTDEATVDVGDSDAAWILSSPPALGWAAIVQTKRVRELELPMDSGWKRIEPGATAKVAAAVELVSLEMRATVDGSRETAASAKITLYAGQRGMFEILDRLSYVQDFDVERSRDGTAVIVDPVVATAAEGLHVEVTALPGASAGQRVLDGRIVSTWIERPVRTFEAHLGAAAPAKIQLPVTHERVTPFRVALARGGEARLPTVLRRKGGAAVPATLTLRYVDAGPKPPP